MFVVLLTGAPGAGKTATLTALTDALIVDEIHHASVDADEVAWAYPFPDLDARSAHLGIWRGAHARAGHDLLLVAETIESQAHLDGVLGALGAEDHLLVVLDAEPDTLRDRIVAREPPGWFGLSHLLGETGPLRESLALLEGVHLRLDTERLTPDEVCERIRAARPERLRRPGRR